MDILHSLRNVGEDICRAFHYKGIADVPDMDSAVTELHIHVHATRHLGEVTTALKKSLRMHGITEKTEIVRES